MSYIKEAKILSNGAFDWINRVLKADNKNGGENAEI
jgi:hypothetical protein